MHPILGKIGQIEIIQPASMIDCQFPLSFLSWSWVFQISAMKQNQMTPQVVDRL